jgi:hypothetical protein
VKNRCITDEKFGFANLSLIVQTEILPVLREQQTGNKTINQNSWLGYCNRWFETTNGSLSGGLPS